MSQKLFVVTEIVDESKVMSGAIASIIMDIFLSRANDDSDISARFVASKFADILLESALLSIKGRDFVFAKLSKIRLPRAYVVFWVNLFSMSLRRRSGITSSFIGDTFLSSVSSLLKEVLFSSK